MTDLDIAVLADEGHLVLPERPRSIHARSRVKSIAFRTAGGIAGAAAGTVSFATAYYVVNGSPIVGGHLAPAAHSYVGLLCLAAIVRGVSVGISVERGSRSVTHTDQVSVSVHRKLPANPPLQQTHDVPR